MITEQDLLSAIAECQGERNPNANTCIKLAAYYTILDNIRPPKETAEQPHAYSFAPLNSFGRRDIHLMPLAKKQRSAPSRC